MTIQLSTALFELAVNGMAAVCFGLVLLPLGYIIGVRDGRRNAMSRGVAVGYQRCLNSLKELQCPSLILPAGRPAKPAAVDSSPLSAPTS